MALCPHETDQGVLWSPHSGTELRGETGRAPPQRAGAPAASGLCTCAAREREELYILFVRTWRASESAVRILYTQVPGLFLLCEVVTHTHTHTQTDATGARARAPPRARDLTTHEKGELRGARARTLYAKS